MAHFNKRNSGRTKDERKLSKRAKKYQKLTEVESEKS